MTEIDKKNGIRSGRVNLIRDGVSSSNESFCLMEVVYDY
jgi:hypothetical protein